MFPVKIVAGTEKQFETFLRRTFRKGKTEIYGNYKFTMLGGYRLKLCRS